MFTADSIGANLWEDFEHGATALLTPRYGTAPVHGIALDQIVSSLKNIEFKRHFVSREDRIALEQTRLIVLGNLSEFGPEAERLVRPSGYPARFEVSCNETGSCIVDHLADPGHPLAAISCAHVGLVFRGQAHDLGRPSLIFAGTSPLGILAGTLWATQAGLANIPAPPDGQQGPIEALIQIIDPEFGLPAISHLNSVHLVCGTAQYDSSSGVWKSPMRRSSIQVVRDNAGVPLLIRVGKSEVRVSEAAKAQLLLLLIRRREKGAWTTLTEAQFRFDKYEDALRIKTLKVRLAEIVRDSQDPDLLETKQIDGQIAYRLRVQVVYVDTLRP